MASVERQLRSHVPVGVMLSGGMDSSVLTCLVNDILPTGNLHTFGLRFDDRSFDESKDAQAVAKHFNTNHHDIHVTPQKVIVCMDEHLEFIDEPYADGAAIPTYLLSKQAKQNVGVVLSGEGGDEVFGGYETYLANKVRNWYRHIPSPIRNHFIAPLVNFLPVSQKKLSFDFKAKRFVKGAELSASEAHHYWRHVLNHKQKQHMFNLPIESYPPSVQLFHSKFQELDHRDELDRLMWVDLHFHLPDDLMIKNDRMTMAHSLEARVPFLDTELVSFLLKVPSHHKIVGRQLKFIMRDLFKHRLPPRIISKKKKGLEMPYSIWMCKELKKPLADLFTSQRIKRTELINPGFVDDIWRDHQNLRHDHGRFLWGLAMYILWFEKYIL